MAAFLSVPAAIDFQAQHNWKTVRMRCRALARETRRRVHALTGLEPICPEEGGWFEQMFASPLPVPSPELFQRRLYERCRIEVPVYRWGDRVLIRPSFQAYNDEADADLLVEALQDLPPDAPGKKWYSKGPLHCPH